MLFDVQIDGHRRTFSFPSSPYYKDLLANPEHKKACADALLTEDTLSTIIQDNNLLILSSHFNEPEYQARIINLLLLPKFYKAFEEGTSCLTIFWERLKKEKDVFKKIELPFADMTTEQLKNFTKLFPEHKTEAAAELAKRHCCSRFAKQIMGCWQTLWHKGNDRNQVISNSQTPSLGKKDN